MAKLTDVIGTEMNGQETQRPVEPAPSWLEGLAKGLQGVGNVMDTASSAIDAEKQERARAAKAAQEASDRGIQNFGAEMLLNLGSAEANAEDPNTAQMPQPKQPTPLDIVTDGGNATNVSTKAVSPTQQAPLTATEVQTAAAAMAKGEEIGQKAARLQAGVKQGRVSRAAYEMQIESIMRQGFALFPDSKYILLEQMNKYAIEHPIMSEYRTAKKLEEKQIESAAEREEAFIDHAATKMGYDPEQYDRNTMIQLGRKGIQSEYSLKQIRDEYEFNRRVTENNREDQDRVVKAHDDATAKWVHSALSPQFGAAIDLFNSVVQDANIPEGKRIEAASEFINTFQPRAYSLIENTLTRAIADGGMSQTVADAERTRLRAQVDDIFAQFNSDNPLNVIVTNGKILQVMKDKIGLEMHEAMPVYNAFKQAFGDSESVQVLVDQIATDPKLVSAFTREMKGFTGLQLGDQTVRIRNMIAFMTDQNTSLRDYPPEQSKQIIVDSYKLIRGGMLTNALKGNTTAQRTVLNAWGKTANAAMDLNQGNSTRDLTNASLMLSSRPFLALTQRAAPEHKEMLGLVVDETRAAVQKLTIALMQQNSADAFHAIKFDESRGQFVIAPTGKRSSGQVASSSFREGTWRNVDTTPPPSPETKEKLLALNSNLGWLLSTTKFEDHPALKSATKAEQLRFYTTGQLPEAARPKEGDRQNGLKVISRLQNYWAGVKIDWKSIPKVDIEEDVERRSGVSRGGGRNDDPYNTVLGHGKYGSPDRPLTELSLKEAIRFGKDVLIPRSKADGVGRDSRGLLGSSAMGAYQFTQSTLSEIAPKVLGDGWEDMKMSPEVQEKLARYLFEKNKSGNLKNTWEGLPDSRPGAYADMTWEQVRDIIVRKEVSSSGSTLDRDLARAREARGGKGYTRY